MSDTQNMSLKLKHPNTHKYQRSTKPYKSKTYTRYNPSRRDQSYDPIKYYHLFVI